MGQKCCSFAYFWPFGVAECAPQVLVNSIFSLTQLETWGAVWQHGPRTTDVLNSRLENFFCTCSEFWCFRSVEKATWEVLAVSAKRKSPLGRTL